MKKKKKVGINNKHRSNQSSPNKRIENSRGRKVEFVLPAPEGKEVYLAGEFNGWDPQSLPMVRDEGGAWEAEMELLPGRYEFKPLIDGAWREDVSCRVMIAAISFKLILDLEKVSNPLGTQNFAFWIK
jgi:1,4-alpha-glucan branching enzyme